MIPAPLTALPIVTHNRFQATPPSVTVGGCSARSAIDNKVMFATECSHPLAMSKQPFPQQERRP